MKVAIVVYAGTMVVANLLVAHFGPAASPIIAFLLIGLELVLRDWLHMRIKVWQMGLLIACTGCLSFVLNPAAGQIALASSVAFMLAAIADWVVFAKLKGSWLVRSNKSNLVGASIDSIVFPTIAFGALMIEIVFLQFFAKVLGGMVWSYLINKMRY